MAAASTKKTKKTGDAWFDIGVDIDSLSSNEQIAHHVVTRYRDLTPSVEKIMNAEIADDARGRALTAFSDSIGQTGDPNRDPRVAIENALRTTAEAPAT